MPSEIILASFLIQLHSNCRSSLLLMREKLLLCSIFKLRINFIVNHFFSVMIETANEWLQKNIEWEVVNCETVILLYKYNDTGNYNELRPNDCCFYIYGSEKNNVLKALR